MEVEKGWTSRGLASSLMSAALHLVLPRPWLLSGKKDEKGQNVPLVKREATDRMHELRTDGVPWWDTIKTVVHPPGNPGWSIIFDGSLDIRRAVLRAREGQKNSEETIHTLEIFSLSPPADVQPIRLVSFLAVAKMATQSHTTAPLPYFPLMYFFTVSLHTVVHFCFSSAVQNLLMIRPTVPGKSIMNSSTFSNRLCLGTTWTLTSSKPWSARFFSTHLASSQ